MSKIYCYKFLFIIAILIVGCQPEENKIFLMAVGLNEPVEIFYDHWGISHIYKYQDIRQIRSQKSLIAIQFSV